MKKISILIVGMAAACVAGSLWADSTNNTAPSSGGDRPNVQLSTIGSATGGAGSGKASIAETSKSGKMVRKAGGKGSKGKGGSNSLGDSLGKGKGKGTKGKGGSNSIGDNWGKGKGSSGKGKQGSFPKGDHFNQTNGFKTGQGTSDGNKPPGPAGFGGPGIQAK